MAEEAVTEVAETVILSTYDKVGAVMSGVFVVIFGALILYRLGRSFHSYIYTGEFSRFIEGSIFATLIDESPEKSWKAFLTGTNPFGIAIDALLPCTLIVLAMPFAWGGLVPLMLIVLLAHVMRKRIAKKQDFVAKLDGTHPDLGPGNGSNDMSNTTQSFTGGGA